MCDAGSRRLSLSVSAVHCISYLHDQHRFIVSLTHVHNTKNVRHLHTRLIQVNMLYIWLTDWYWATKDSSSYSSPLLSSKEFFGSLVVEDYLILGFSEPGLLLVRHFQVEGNFLHAGYLYVAGTHKFCSSVSVRIKSLCLIEHMLHGLGLGLMYHPNDVASFFSVYDT